jgi:hypothetical protein
VKDRHGIADVAKSGNSEEAGRKIGAGKCPKGMLIFLPQFSCQLSEP